MNISVQGRAETSERGSVTRDSLGRELRGVAPGMRRSLRLSASYAFTRALRTRARLERVYASEPAGSPESGWLLYQDVRWQPRPSIRLDARWSYFDTDGYSARVYALENDLLYTFSAPAFFGRGGRAYVLARLEPLPHLMVQFKYGLTQRSESVQPPADSGRDAMRSRDINVLIRLTI